MGWNKEQWDRVPGGEPAELYVLEHNGLHAEISDFGGLVRSLAVPTERGLVDVVLGYDTPREYLSNGGYFGALVGRCANRIGGARFVLDGEEYRLDVNHGKHQLHGGTHGFSSLIWRAQGTETPDGPGVELGLTSPHLDQGYPGTLVVRVAYTLLEDGLRIEYEARTDLPTVVDLTNHAYFNLAGSGDCLDHELAMGASRYLATDAEQIPTGEVADVTGTAMDFTAPHVIGERIDADEEPLRFGSGYDHFYVIDQEPGLMRDAARVACARSGLAMTLRTDCAGFQFYSGNYIEPGTPGKHGAVYGHRAGFCLEAQGYPDAINNPTFPTPVLRPGEVYRRLTEYRFG